MKKRVGFVGAAAAAGASALMLAGTVAPAQAATTDYSVAMNEANVVPPGVGTSTATATLAVNDVNERICIDITNTTLTGTLFARITFGPAGQGQSLPGFVFPQMTAGGPNPDLSGCVVTTDAFTSDLIANPTNYNVQVGQLGGPSVRGQLVFVPPTTRTTRVTTTTTNNSTTSTTGTVIPVAITPRFTG